MSTVPHRAACVRVVHILAVLFAFAGVLAAAEKKEISDEEIADLISKLGDDSFGLREKAGANLRAIGAPALPQLRIAAKSAKDAEIKDRSARLVDQIEKTLYGLRKQVGPSVEGLGLKGWTTRVLPVYSPPESKASLAVAAGQDLKVYDLNTAEVVQTLLDSDPDGLWSLGVSAKGDRVIAAGNGKTIRVFDVKTGKRVALLEGHADAVWGVALSADGKTAYSTAWDKTVRFWDVEAGKQTHKLETDEKGRCLALSPDGKILATGHFTGDIGPATVRLWSTESAKFLRELKGHRGAITSIIFSAEGDKIATGSFDMTARLWSTADGKEIKLFQHNARIEAVALTPDGTRLVIAGNEKDGTLRVFDTADARQVWASEAIPGGFMGMALLANGRDVVTVGKERSVQVWSLKLGE